MAVSLCDLAMMAYPHTVLLPRLAESRKRASEGPARGRGSPRSPEAVKRRVAQSQSECPIKARGAALQCRVRHRVHPLCSLSAHTTTSSFTKSLGQALRVSLVKPGAYLSESYWFPFGENNPVVMGWKNRGRSRITNYPCTLLTKSAPNIRLQLTPYSLRRA
jgi:hypothetical protein